MEANTNPMSALKTEGSTTKQMVEVLEEEKGGQFKGTH